MGLGAGGLVNGVKTAGTGRMPGSWPWKPPLAGCSSENCVGKKEYLRQSVLHYGTGYWS